MPFPLARNGQQPATYNSEVDVTEHLPQSVDASDPTDVTDSTSTLDAQTKIDLLSGKWEPTMPVSENDDLSLPADGGNYALGTIGTQAGAGLGFSWDTPLCKHGVSVVFTAGGDFSIFLPFAYEEEGEPVAPLYPAYTAGETELACESGKTYVLFISAILAGFETVSGRNVFKYGNMFSLQELTEVTDPEASE